MNKTFFGTDGIRGKVGEFPITPDFVLQLGWAIGDFLINRNPGRTSIAVIGKDTRISGYMFESALQAGLVAAGVNVKLLGPMPTPGIAYITRTMRADIGIVISASHNPYYDNGIKFFGTDGSKLSDESELAIESHLKKTFVTVPSEKIGKATRVNDAPGRYIEYCKSTLPYGFTLTDKRIVLDCAHGATYHIAGKVFKELDATVVTMGTEPDGLNINEGVGSTSPAALQRRVLEEQADLGIAFDGDGDRVIFVDRQGEVIDGDQLLYLIAVATDPSQPGYEGIVGTQMTNMGVELALRRLGFDFYRAKVGDRYVKEAMNERGWVLGGESSGHIICGDVTSTGDGIISSLKVLKALSDRRASLEKTLKDVSKFPQKMVNVAVGNQRAICEEAQVLAAVADIEKQLDGSGRVLLRPSGTEPLVRVMVEARETRLVDAFVTELSDLVRQVAEDQ